MARTPRCNEDRDDPTFIHGTRLAKTDLAASIGKTPLIRLRRASEATGCTILGKAEFMNPGGSVKDRAASTSSTMPSSAAR